MKKGDIVKLRGITRTFISDGLSYVIPEVIMVVEGFRTGSEVKTVWFDKEGNLQRDTFPVETLECLTPNKKEVVPTRPTPPNFIEEIAELGLSKFDVTVNPTFYWNLISEHSVDTSNTTRTRCIKIEDYVFSDKTKFLEYMKDYKNNTVVFMINPTNKSIYWPKPGCGCHLSKVRMYIFNKNSIKYNDGGER